MKAKKEDIKKQNPKEIKYSTSSGDEVTLSIDIVKKYLTTNAKVTNQECMMFLQLCKFRRLNPFVGEASLIKYGDYPASIIVQKGYFLRVADSRPEYNGFSAGIIVQKEGGEIYEKEGSMVLTGETLIGGWAKVNIKDREKPHYVDVPMSEYVQRKKDGSPNNQWKTMPTTMIRKVAIVHALRESFPKELIGVYDESEIGAIQNKILLENEDAQEAEELYSILEKKLVEKQQEDEIDISTGEIKIEEIDMLEPSEIPFE
jgi:phage recombination protein Bet